jgi:serine/threonine-protein kinase
MTFCTNCGKQMTPGAQKCDACGIALLAVHTTPPEAPKSGIQSGSDKLQTQITNPQAGQGASQTKADATLPLQSVGAQVGRVLGGRYQLSQVIGSGGMGEIYRARRLHIGDTVAVKVLRPDVVENEKSRQRFYREARAAAMLHHPNAVVIHDFGEDTDGTAYIVMELLLGRSLRQVLVEEGTVNALRCYGIIRQACAALDAGHRNGIIHRDIKPDNIILLDSNDGVDHIKILDFGIAKLRDQALDTLSMEQRLTNVGTVIGTPHYMAPEQCQGEEADARSDIYSLGVVLYELLTGVAPFLAKTPTGVAIKHVTEKPRPLRELNPGVSESVGRVVLKALEKDPNVRQQTALELARDFESAIRSESTAETLIRSGEQTLIDHDTLRLARAQKTEGMATPPETGASRPVENPAGFETAVNVPPVTDQFKESMTGPVPPKVTAEQKPLTDNLRTQFIPPTELLGSETDILPQASPPASPKVSTPPPEPSRPTAVDPLRTDPYIPASAALGPPPADVRPAAEKPAAVEPPRPAKPGKENATPRLAQAEKKGESSVRSTVPAPAAPAKSKMPLLAAAAGVVLVLGAIGAWMLSGGKSNTASVSPSPTVAPSVEAQATPAASPTSAYPEVIAPEGMVFVLGGPLQIGREDGEENEKPVHTVTIKPFFMDKTEVTNLQYQNFIEATNYTPPPIWKGAQFPAGEETLPVRDVTWEDARAYAEWAGKRLPTEEEWEFAARGPEGRLYPWGEKFIPDAANVKADNGEKRDLMPVGHFVAGTSPFGIVDMAGNAYEWTASDYIAYPGGKLTTPEGFKNLKVIRGGSYESAPAQVTTTRRRGWPATRTDWPPGQTANYAQMGFRCVQDP